MGSTNILQFNPTQANQETDSEYLVDSTRTGGAGVDALWPSVSANKTLYQISTLSAAFAQALANKGYTISDANLGTLTAVLANVLTTADVPGQLQSVSYAATLTLNAAAYSGFQVALAGNVTLSISGQTTGQAITLLFVQDASGGHTVVFPAGTIGAAQPDPTAGAISAQLFKVDAAYTLVAVGPSVSSSGMGGLAIGTANAAPGNFSTLKVAGAAPSGQVLTGNGTSYVPVAAPGFTSGSNANGHWYKNPAGLITQYILVPAIAGSSTTTFNYPTTFPVACLGVQATIYDPAGVAQENVVTVESYTTSAATVFNYHTGSPSLFVTVVGY